MRAHLVDLSKYQVSFDPSKIKAENGAVVDGVIIRAGYGLMGDRLFQPLTAAAQSIPVRGTYHYFSSAAPWEQQARFFVRRVEDKGFHFHALDFETAYNNISAGFGLAAQRWLNYVAERTGKKVVLYINPNTYNELTSMYKQTWMNDWPLWIAQWPYPGWKDVLTRVRTENLLTPWLPRGRRDWTFWQYSADGNLRGADFGVGSRSVDLNVFNGTMLELHAWAIGVTPTVPDVPIPAPEPPAPIPPTPEPPEDEDTKPLPPVVIPPPEPPTSLIELVFDWLIKLIKAFEDWRKK